MQIHAIWSSALVLFSLCLLSGAADAGTRASDEFLGHTFTLKLLDGYSPFGSASPAANARTFGFATEARPDGTRGMASGAATSRSTHGAPRQPVGREGVRPPVPRMTEAFG